MLRLNVSWSPWGVSGEPLDVDALHTERSAGIEALHEDPPGKHRECMSNLSVDERMQLEVAAYRAGLRATAFVLIDKRHRTIPIPYDLTIIHSLGSVNISFRYLCTLLQT